MPLSIETEEVTDEATTVLEVFDTLVATFQLDLPYSVALFSLLSAWFFEILVSLLPNTKNSILLDNWLQMGIDSSN